jgi:O-antigen/teichoic acid export membrane protein
MSIEEDISPHATARGMLLLAGKDIIATIAAIVFFILIARLLPSVADLGVLTGLQTIILMFVTLSGLGLPYAATRFISTYVGAGEKERALSLYPLILIFSTAVSGIFSFVLYVISPQISDILFRDSASTQLIRLASVDVFLYSLLTTCIFLLSASMEFKKVAIVSIFNSILKYSISFGLFAVGSGLYGIIFGLVLGDAVTLIIFIYALSPKIFRTKMRVLSTLPELKPLLKYAVSIYGSLVLTFLSFRIDVYLLMVLSTMYMVGIFSPAVFVAATFLILLVAMDQALLPITSRLFGKSGTVSFKSSSRYVSRYLFLFYFPFGFALAASAPSLVTIVMGERFIESVYPIIIIVVSITLTSPGVVVNNLLRSAGYPGVLLKSSAVGLAIQIILSVITIPSMGVLGAAAARFVSRFVFFAYPVYKLHKIGGFEIDRIALRNGLAASALVSIAILGVNSILVGSYSIIVQYFIAFFSCIVFFRIIGAINKKDIELIDKTLLGKMKWVTIPLGKIVLPKNVNQS